LFQKLKGDTTLKDFKTNKDYICRDTETLAKFMATVSSDCAACPMVTTCDCLFGAEGCTDDACRVLLLSWLNRPYEAPKQPKRSKIIAIDFDGTLCDSTWPHCGEPIWETINRYRKEREEGTKFILWTNRVGEPLIEAVRWCYTYDICFDAINENLPEVVAWFGNDCRKVFANEYWDDRTIYLEHLKHPDKKD
jgi:hypothetical protein